MSDCRRRPLVAFLIAGAFVAGCAHKQAQTVDRSPSPKATKPRFGGPLVAQYAMPRGQPKGTVWIRSFGPQLLTGQRRWHGTFLHVSMEVENASDAVTWSLDPRDMKLNFVGSRRPIRARTKTMRTGTMLPIARGMHGYLDLYFPWNKRIRPLHVNFLWQLHRGSEIDTVNTRINFSWTPSSG